MLQPLALLSLSRIDRSTSTSTRSTTEPCQVDTPAVNWSFILGNLLDSISHPRPLFSPGRQGETSNRIDQFIDPERYFMALTHLLPALAACLDGCLFHLLSLPALLPSPGFSICNTAAHSSRLLQSFSRLPSSAMSVLVFYPISSAANVEVPSANLRDGRCLCHLASRQPTGGQEAQKNFLFLRCRRGGYTGLGWGNS